MNFKLCSGTGVENRKPAQVPSASELLHAAAIYRGLEELDSRFSSPCVAGQRDVESDDLSHACMSTHATPTNCHKAKSRLLWASSGHQVSGVAANSGERAYPAKAGHPSKLPTNLSGSDRSYARPCSLPGDHRIPAESLLAIVYDEGWRGERLHLDERTNCECDRPAQFNLHRQGKKPGSTGLLLEPGEPLITGARYSDGAFTLGAADEAKATCKSWIGSERLTSPIQFSN